MGRYYFGPKELIDELNYNDPPVSENISFNDTKIEPEYVAPLAPEVITKIVFVDKPTYLDKIIEVPGPERIIEKEIIKYIDKPIEKIVYVDKWIEVPVPSEPIIKEVFIEKEIIKKVIPKWVYIVLILETISGILGLFIK